MEANIDPQFVLLHEHQAALMLEAVVDESLSDAIHHGNDLIVQLAQGVGGRGSLSAMLVDLYRDYRGEGLSLEEIKNFTAANHSLETEYASVLAELDARMAELLAVPARTASAHEKRDKVAAQWPRLRAILATPPSEHTIAKYSQAIEDFYGARPREGSNPVVPAVDELLWGENSKSDERLAGKLPCVGFDLLANDYALAVLKLRSEVEHRWKTRSNGCRCSIRRPAAANFEALESA